jgi:hypothetical protein
MGRPDRRLHFRICQELGYPHPDYWLERITSSQLAEWEAYDRIEPIGGYRQDYRFAQVCHLIFDLAQSIYGKRGQRRKSSPMDFMPWGPEQKVPVKKQTVEEMKQTMIAAFKPKAKK